MKKLLTAVIAIALSVASVAAQQQNIMETIKRGKMDVYDFTDFKLHVYRALDALGDVSFIVEGSNALVTLEHPLFKENIAEYNAYVAALGKPVEKIIANYHTGGFADYHHHDVIMMKGMPEFEVGEIYGGMIKRFVNFFGDAIDVRPHAEVTTVDFGATQKWAGVEFEFSRGASSDFPAASIIIGGKVYYTHWTPAKAHISNLQISSPAAIDAEMAEAQKELVSGCELFVGGHGGTATKADVEFKIEYLKTLKSLLATERDATSFAKALKTIYPNLAGEEGVAALAEALYR